MFIYDSSSHTDWTQKNRESWESKTGSKIF
jgi:hypothetical protein